MPRHRLCLCAVVSLIGLLAGCGGGSGTPPAQTTEVGAASGTVETQGEAPGDFQLVLDGQRLQLPIDPNGTFRIPNIPPGDHVLDVMGADGMRGGRAEFHIEAGAESEIPPIRPVPRGQIAGLVLKWENGGLMPAGGVEVVARCDLYWIADESGEGRTVVDSAGAQAPGARPLIYPPPPGHTYRAFTDRSGSYLMQNVLPGPYMVSVVVPGFYPAHRFILVRPGHTATADFRLRPVATPELGKIVGTVVNADPDTNFEPIEGARIWVVVTNPWAPPAPGPTDGSMGPVEVPEGVQFPVLGPVSPANEPGEEPAFMPPDIRWRVFSTRTNDEGYYELKVPAGRRVVNCWAWGFWPQRRPVIVPEGDTIKVSFRLLPMPTPQPAPVPEPLPPATAG